MSGSVIPEPEPSAALRAPNTVGGIVRGEIVNRAAPYVTILWNGRRMTGKPLTHDEILAIEAAE